MKIKIISLLICTLFIISIFSVFATAKNLVSINMSFVDSNVELRGDLIKTTGKDLVCEIGEYYVVYPENTINSTYLYIYYINTGDY